MARKSRVNEGILNPETAILLIDCAATDLFVQQEDSGRVTVMVENLKGGIEIVHCDDRIWWPV